VGQRVVADKRAGAGGTIGPDLVARKRRPTLTRC
jgi:tripartite-type tricarboxylate transporter receptor subunit TctC